MSYVIGGKDYVLNDYQWLYQPYFKDEKEGKTKMCRSSIMKLDMTDDQFLLGNHFMNKYFVVFDRDNDRIGLAESVLDDRHMAVLTQKKHSFLQAKK
mmetsp:Transcript_39650/g.60724  ORF Transcript_39650/g.60724 Transcript_39650/m.60724 type:complete len:97 (+) Transcript_39650:1023-1313(+)